MTCDKFRCIKLPKQLPIVDSFFVQKLLVALNNLFIYFLFLFHKEKFQGFKINLAFLNKLFSMQCTQCSLIRFLETFLKVEQFLLNSCFLMIQFDSWGAVHKRSLGGRQGVWAREKNYFKTFLQNFLKQTKQHLWMTPVINIWERAVCKRRSMARRVVKYLGHNANLIIWSFLEEFLKQVG